MPEPALNAAEVRVTALRREAREAGDALNAARLEAERRESAAALARAALERTERTALERHAARDDAERAWQEALTPLHPLSRPVRCGCPSCAGGPPRAA